MPELPELEAIKRILSPKLSGIRIDNAEFLQPYVIQQPSVREFVSTLTGNSFDKIDRQGKFLLFTFTSRHVMAIHPMLSGRFQYCEPEERHELRTCFILHLQGGKQLRYFDPDLMGKLYLVKGEQLSLIPRWKEMGPDALDDKLTLELFQGRLGQYRGRIKNILIKDALVSGIGNAYADEILFAARIHPFRERKSLSEGETKSLYHAMHSILKEAVEILSQRMEGDISMEIRDFLKLHRKGGEPCPYCGESISQVEISRRITNFCPNCQKE